VVKAVDPLDSDDEDVSDHNIRIDISEESNCCSI
jgi:hypothetical protein